MNLFVIDHKDSLEKIERGGQIVKIIGKGIIKSPGYPAGNQQYHTQLPFLIESTKEPYLFPVFNKKQNGNISYLGKYKILNYQIKISFNGFRYFEYTMMRVFHNTQYVENVILPELIEQ
jgi:hypothetical protein